MLRHVSRGCYVHVGLMAAHSERTTTGPRGGWRKQSAREECQKHSHERPTQKSKDPLSHLHCTRKRPDETWLPMDKSAQLKRRPSQPSIPYTRGASRLQGKKPKK
jgi:hypothetical protein